MYVCVCARVCMSVCVVWRSVIQGCRSVNCYIKLNVIDEGTYGIVCMCLVLMCVRKRDSERE